MFCVCRKDSAVVRARDTWCSRPSPRRALRLMQRSSSVEVNTCARWADSRARALPLAVQESVEFFELAAPELPRSENPEHLSKNKKAERLILAEIRSNSAVFLLPRRHGPSLPPPVLDCPFGPVIRLPFLFLIKTELLFNYIIHGAFQIRRRVFSHRYSRSH